MRRVSIAPGTRRFQLVGEGEEPGFVAGLRGRRLDLTLTEFKLLASLVEREGEVVARDQLLREVWGHQGPVRSRTVDTHIRRLRDKLGADRACVATVRGQGYCVRPDL